VIKAFRSNADIGIWNAIPIQASEFGKQFQYKSLEREISHKDFGFGKRHHRPLPYGGSKNPPSAPGRIQISSFQ
jgi:hypothetical protein